MVTRHPSSNLVYHLPPARLHLNRGGGAACQADRSKPVRSALALGVSASLAVGNSVASLQRNGSYGIKAFPRRLCERGNRCAGAAHPRKQRRALACNAYFPLSWVPAFLIRSIFTPSWLPASGYSRSCTHPMVTARPFLPCGLDSPSAMAGDDRDGALDLAGCFAGETPAELGVLAFPHQ